MLDEASQARFERERMQHFPARINLIPAHVTLFHHLPGAELAAVDEALTAVCRSQATVPFSVTGLRFLGRGTAYALHMPEMEAVRRGLAAAWQPWLTAQDRQGWRPHVTIQNKVPPDEAKRLHGRLLAGFTPQDGTVAGLKLWRYLGGPWQALGAYGFAGRLPPGGGPCITGS